MAQAELAVPTVEAVALGDGVITAVATKGLAVAAMAVPAQSE